MAIDQPSIDGIRNNPTYARNFGNYPWTRSLWARIVEELAASGARAVLFDAVMDERYTDASADLAFAQVLRDTGLPFYLGVSTHPAATPLPEGGAALTHRAAARRPNRMPAEALPPRRGREEFAGGGGPQAPARGSAGRRRGRWPSR